MLERARTRVMEQGHRLPGNRLVPSPRKRAEADLGGHRAIFDRKSTFRRVKTKPEQWKQGHCPSGNCLVPSPGHWKDSEQKRTSELAKRVFVA